MSRRTPLALPYPRIGLLAAAAAVLALAAAGLAAANHAARPHKPKPLRVLSTSTTSVGLSWKRTAPRFVVARNHRRVDSTTRRRYTFRNLRCDRVYRLGVRAVSRSGARSTVVSRRVRTRRCPAPPETPPASVTAPRVTGTPVVGNVLGSNRGAWTGSPTIAYGYEWLRCDASGEDCSPIPGATSSARFLAAEDEGTRLRIRVTATNAYGSATATSSPSGVVAAAPTGGACTRADATECAAVAGSRIVLLNQRSTIDLVVEIEGDGRTVGGTSDAMKVRLDPHDIQLTGYANCGPRGLGPDGRPNTIDDAHQDGAQIQGGDNVEFIDFEWGDWDTNTATCQGAAGTFVPGSVNGNAVDDMACIRCKSVSCNHGMLFSGSAGTLVVDSMWRTGNPADRTVLLANGHIGLCQYGGPACLIDESKATTYTVLGNYCDRWPYGDGT